MKIRAYLTALMLLFAASFAASDYNIVTNDEKAFFVDLRDAIVADDATGVAKLILYPLTVRRDGKEIALKGPSDFVARYREVITADVKSAVKAQNPDKLFKNWQGVMIGDGTIWFTGTKRDGEKNYVIKIIGINP